MQKLSTSRSTDYRSDGTQHPPGLIRLPQEPLGLSPIQISSLSTLARAGSLEARLANRERDVKSAQHLRYRVFYEEGGAIADFQTEIKQRDRDLFDTHCDHVIVVDHDVTVRRMTRKGLRREPLTVGTYRLLRRSVAEQTCGFYSSSEYDLDPLLSARPNIEILELGRSCVLSGYRNKRTIDLLWQGIWTYIRHHRVDAMMGCASFGGVNPRSIAEPLSYLYRNALAPGQWRVSARPKRYVAMDRPSQTSVSARAALRQLPPLIKAYLRLGAYVGDGAVIDYQFGTTDVFMLLPVSNIDPRYFEHFGAPDERPQ